jgi:hypothetical protein
MSQRGNVPALFHNRGGDEGAFRCGPAAGKSRVTSL